MDLLKPFLTEDEISDCVKELGTLITKDYQEKKDIVIVAILKGSVVFFADLIRQIKTDIEIDFMIVSSYQNATESSGKVKIIKDLDRTIEGKHILLVEDILDSGRTLTNIVEIIKTKNPSSIKTCVLLDKPERRKVEITPDYCGFTIPDEFIVGYGLDYAEKYRNLPYIALLKTLQE